MASYLSDQLTDQAASPVVMTSAIEGGAKVYFKYANIAIPAADAADDELYYMLDLPVGAVLIPQLSYLIAEDLGTDVDAEVYLGTTKVLAATGVDAAATQTQITPGFLMTPLTAVTRMHIKLVSGGGGTAYTAAAKMELQVAYCMQGG